MTFMSYLKPICTQLINGTRLETNFDKFSREESFKVASLDGQLIESQTIIWGMPINVEQKANTLI